MSNWNVIEAPAARLTRLLALCALTVLAAGAGAAAQAQAATPAATDWTSVAASQAAGTLVGTPVTLSGGHVWDVPVSRTDGSWPYFSGPDFVPSLPSTDELQISGGATPYTYTLSFGTPVTDPVLEIGSLASKIEFTNATGVTKLGGDSGFTTTTSSVTGTLRSTTPGPEYVYDASGTVKVTGTYTSLTFKATKLYQGGGEDGILVQVVVAQPTFTDWTAVASNAATGSLLGKTVRLAGGHVFDVLGSVTDGSWPYFFGPDFTPSLATSDEIEIGGGPAPGGHAYTLSFSDWVTDPILEIGSLASKLVFTNVGRISKLGAGDLGFTVDANTVTGTLRATTPGPEHVYDASGTIKLTGTYRNIGFSATKLYAGSSDDGIVVQVGSSPGY
jgi:hypothetical protein